MSINAINNKPAAPTKAALSTSSAHAASAQAAAAAAAAAFAAHLKKNQAEQLSRAMRHARRDGVGRLLAADESAPGIAQLLSAGEDAVTCIDQRHQGGQGQSEKRQQNQQAGEQDREQNRETNAPHELQQDDTDNEREQVRYTERSSALDQHIAALAGGNDASTNALAERLAPLSANDGLFDVLHPDGSVLSVAVTHTPARVSLLLNTTSEGVNAQLKRCKMELEQRLARRMGKDVVIAIL